MRDGLGRMAAVAVVWAACAGVAALTAYGQSATPAAAAAARGSAADVPVRAVTLFSSGVGYFEHFGTVTGNTSAELNFKTAQINDILKSLVLQDLDGGRVSAVNYASQEPLDRKLRSFQVDVSGNPGLGELLGQLRGAKVLLREGDREIAGTILGVEKKQVGQGQAVVERNVISVLSGGGMIRSAVVEELREVVLQDEALREELGRALEALAGARDQEKKSVELRFLGDGERRVRVGYVVETPVWKTSYRLLLGEKPSIQGWAIVENQTDTDWKDVQLSLVSGRPISFVQDLYTPLFVSRPVVVPELFASLRPQRYGEASKLADREAGEAFGDERQRSLARRAAPMPAPSMAPGSAAGGGYAGQLRQNEMAAMDASASVQSVASAVSLGELFQYTVGSVTLPRQTSAMIPIVTDPVDVERVSIYNAGVMPRHPLSGAIVRNTTGKHLLAGPITVFDAGTYAGDAQIDNVPPGQQRMVSYGVDLQVLVDAGRDETRQEVMTAGVSKGVLTVGRKVVASRAYSIENKSDRDRVIVVEHPRRGGTWKLVDTPTPFEQTDSVYRFKDTVAAGKTKVLTVREETVTSEGVALLNFDVDDFLRYAQTGAIPANVREALQRGAAMRREVVTAEREIAAVQQQIAEITAEQTRIRDNYRSVQQNTDYARRLLEKLNEQETQIEGLQKRLGELRGTLEARRKALSDYLAGLELR